jgi:hypothetical protein
MSLLPPKLSIYTISHKIPRKIYKAFIPAKTFLGGKFSSFRSLVSLGSSKEMLQ